MSSKLKYSLIGIFTIISAWSALSFTHAINVLFLPTPLTVSRRLIELISSGEILVDLLSSVYRLAVGFSLGILIGVPVGILMGYSRKVYHTLELSVEFFRSIPVMALFPLFLLFFGLGDTAKFWIAAWSSSFIIMVNTLYGVVNSRKTRQMVAKTMGANQYQILTKIVIPEALPNIFVGLRTGLSIALIVVVMSEMFMGTRVGLGQRIYNSWLLYHIPDMYVGILVAGLLGYFLNKMIIFVQKRLVHWAGK
jgi:ABC-type nitrate/sulfonate/bicarbonate transport system permease component